MTSEPRPGGDELEQLLRSRVLRVSAVSFGLVTGAVAGAGLFVATNWLVLKGGDHVGPHLGLLAQYFPGYSVTPAGSLVGFAWAFTLGFAAGLGGAWLYNRIVQLRHGDRNAPDRA